MVIRGQVLVPPTNTLKNLSPHQLVMVDSVHQLFKTRWTKPDGSCQFGAFAKALQPGHRSPHQVRTSAVFWMRDHPEDFAPFVTGGQEAWDKYLKDMIKPSTWGDNLTLQALCTVYRAYVQVLKEEEDGTRVWMEAGDRGHAQSMFYLFLKQSHYENLVDRSQISS
jgi:hypothetical protein